MTRGGFSLESSRDGGGGEGLLREEGIRGVG